MDAYKTNLKNDDFCAVKKLLTENPDDLYKKEFIVEIVRCNAFKTLKMLVTEFGYQINQDLGVNIMQYFGGTNFTMLQFLVNNGLNLWFKIPNTDNVIVGDTMLYYACKVGNIKTVKYLISCGISVNSVKGEAFDTACCNNHNDIVEFMIDSGLDASYIDKGLYSAAYSKNITMIKLLLQTGADVSKLGSFIDDGDVDKKEYQSLKILLDSGADFDDLLKILCVY